jgi:hypothetical protein
VGREFNITSGAIGWSADDDHEGPRNDRPRRGPDAGSNLAQREPPSRLDQRRRILRHRRRCIPQCFGRSGRGVLPGGRLVFGRPELVLGAVRRQAHPAAQLVRCYVGRCAGTLDLLLVFRPPRDDD